MDQYKEWEKLGIQVYFHFTKEERQEENKRIDTFIASGNGDQKLQTMLPQNQPGHFYTIGSDEFNDGIEKSLTKREVKFIPISKGIQVGSNAYYGKFKRIVEPTQ